MISFTLSCEHGHRFDGWFRGSDDFEDQRKRGLLSCPTCGSHAVDKALMAPQVSTARQRDAARLESIEAQSETTKVVATPPTAQVPEPVKAVMEAVRTLRKKVEEVGDDVGNRFAEEARKIHYGEADERLIYGEASKEDAEALSDEGIEVAVLPVLPEDRN